MLLDIIRQIHAAQSFSIKDNFEVIGFQDITSEEGQIQPPESIEMWAAVKVGFEGNLPESYKTLNLLIGDWVEKNEGALTEKIHNDLKDHLTKSYPNSDLTELGDLENSAIWMDQLDYMPVFDEDQKNTLIIEIELVLHAEPVE